MNISPQISKYWREHAAEARARAKETHNVQAEAVLQEISRIYDQLTDGEAKLETEEVTYNPRLKRHAP